MNDVIEDFRTATPELVILLRLVLALALGAAIGLDRELKERPAGLKTNMLTALAASLFAVIAIEMAHGYATGSPTAVSYDPIRVVEAVTAGVAFLAAGAIIRSGEGVQGLTTGAALWLSGALGVACGVGYYVVALMAAVLAVLVLRVLTRIEKEWIRDADDGARRDAEAE